MRILLVGGGTLGSVAPLLGIAEVVRARRPALTLEWWGTATGPERELVEAAGIPFRSISAGKLRRYVSGANVLDLFRIMVGFVQSMWRFGIVRPAVVLTAGSFVAVPVGWAAYAYNVPVFVHQQDVRVGLANKLLTPCARVITVALKDLLPHWPAGKAIFTGNPVRSSFRHPPAAEQARANLGLEPNKLTLAVLGGGTGALALNQAVYLARARLLERAQVVHLTGQGKAAGLAPEPGYKIVPFTTDTLSVLAAADVVVTRAGMATLSELAALKRAAVVVPLPGTHQEENARYFASNGGVRLLPQAELTPLHLAATVSQLLEHAAERRRLGERLSQLLPVGAAERIADQVEAVLT